MEPPQFSVCLLAHNSANFITAALESVLAQSFGGWELLVSDDGSTDQTGDIVRPFLGDQRIRYAYHPTNLGQAGNWAYAFENTTAPFIATLHADDAWHHDTLALFREAFSADDRMDLAWGSWTRSTAALEPMAHQPKPDDDRIWEGGDILRHVFLANCILPSASAFRRNVIRTIGLPHLPYGMMCDRDWWLRVAGVSRMARSIGRSLVLYRVHSESVTSNFTNDGRLIRELDDLHLRLPEILKTLPDRAALIQSYERELYEFYFRIAISLKIMGVPEEAGMRMRQAMLYRAGHPLTPAEFIKRILFYLGEPGRKLLSIIHGRNRWITAPEAK